MAGLRPWLVSAAITWACAAALIPVHAATVRLYTAGQAAQGRALYAAKCAACHGEALQGASAGALTGPSFQAAWTGTQSGFNGSWASLQPSVDDLDFIIRTTMPKGTAGQLAAEDYTALLAYVLQQNGYPAGPTPLRPDAARLRQMPLRFGNALATRTPPPPARIAGEPGTAPTGAGPSQQELNGAALSTRNWLYHTHDYSGSRYVALDQVDRSNVGRLQLVCAYQIGDEGNFQTGPIVYQGTMYVTTTRSTLALDATSCQLKWRYTWVPRAHEVWRNNRGVAIKDGYVVRGTADGYLLALNASTGALIWAVQAADASQGETFTMPPLLFEDLVLIGPAGSENAISGWVGAFRLQDGSRVWKFSTVPGATSTGSDSWPNPRKITLGGGSVWTPLTLDSDLGELYVAVTNPAPDLPANLRPGENLYTNSVVALDVRTGKLRWYKQLVPNDSHDWDLTQVGPLFTAPIDGRQRRLMATAGKDGILRAVDRESHEVVYARAVTTIRNSDLPVTAAGVVACPGVFGGVQWNGPALQPELGLLYVNAVDWCARFTSAQTVRHIPGHYYLGGTTELVGEARGWLTAIDAASGAVTWQYASKRPMVAAVTTTKGRLVFTGETTGDFLALDALDGRVLYRFYTGGGIGGGIVTYEEGDKQYVAVMSGRPSTTWLAEAGGAPTVFLFALP
jgi:alcohol dehydrogenase (cytochrome c)